MESQLDKLGRNLKSDEYTGLRQQSIARRDEIKVSCIYLNFMVI